MKLLVVGDVHTVVEELDEVERLMTWAEAKALENNASLLLLGDIYNNHAVLRIEVVDFWSTLLERSRAMWQILLGNHDMPQAGTRQDVHSLRIHRNIENVAVYDSHQMVAPAVGMIPYMATSDEFETALNSLREQGAKLIFAHQEFAGSQFENGFFSPAGFPTEKLGDVKVISGHIHTPQTVGNVWYPGAPRWRSIADANVLRAVYLVEVDEDTGEYEVLRAYPTSEVCTPIVLKTVENMEQVEVIKAEPGLRVTVVGTSEFRKAALAHLSQLKIRTRSVHRDEAETKAEVSESVGIGLSLQRYLAAFSPPFLTSHERLEELVAERVKI